MTTVLIVWVSLVVATIGLAVQRKLLTRGEDTNLHLEHGATMVEGQSALAGKLVTIDRWGKTLTIVAFVMGLVIGGIYVYQALMVVPV